MTRIYSQNAGGVGTVTSVSTDSTLIGGPITTAGTLGLNLTNSNIWTGQQVFNTTAPQVGTATASTIASFDTSKNLISLPLVTYPSLTELSYVKGVTSAIQTQLSAVTSYTSTLARNDTGWTDNGTYVFTTNTRNVGVGTVTPSYKLDVAGDINISTGSAVRINGSFAVRGNSAFYNWFFGNSGNSTNTAGYNTALGDSAMQFLGTSAQSNIAVGVNALRYNSGNSNTALGTSALGNNTNGAENTAFGTSLNSNTIGALNTAVGHNSLYYNVSGSGNSGLGWQSLVNTTGGNNVGMGLQAGGANTSGTFNTYIGYSAGNTDGTTVTSATLTNATAIGAYAQVTASNSIVLGGTGSYSVNVGLGVTAPTAALHLRAGTATANTAPFKFTSGTVLTTPEAGVHEYNGNHYLTNANVRFSVGGSLFDSFTDVSVGGAETDIYTHTLAANTLGANGGKIIAEYGVNFVTVGTQLTRLQVYFAGTSLWDSTAVAPSTGTTSARVYVEIIRVSSTVIRYSISLNTTGASGYVYCKVGELTGLTLSNTNILKLTGISSGVGSGVGDIVGRMAYVKFAPAAA